MARLNVGIQGTSETTHEGAPAYGRMTVDQALHRSIMSCLLWEDEFYEDGEDITARILKLARQVPAERLGQIAIHTRTQMHLRHVPLLLLAIMAETGRGSDIVSRAIHATIQRADELAEFVAIYAKLNGTTPDKVRKKLSAQVKKGLAYAFTKFDEYQLAKYDRAGPIRLRDVAFMAHVRAGINQERGVLYAKLVNKDRFPDFTKNGFPVRDAYKLDGKPGLDIPDTWEVALSSGANKKETWERLIRDNKLGYLALLRNLRNMAQAGVDETLVRDAIIARKGAGNVLPFRYVAAARAAPQFEPHIDQALCEAIAELPVLSGKTIILVDVSGSMDNKLSARSDMTRMDAAATLASIIHGDLRVFTFSNSCIEVAPRRGMAGVDAIIKSQMHSGTYLGNALAEVQRYPHDRLIVITDEQSHDHVPPPKKRGYMINVASARNGVGYGPWKHIDGFSEQMLRWIHAVENDR